MSDSADIKDILKNEINSVDAEKPTSLPPFEPAVAVYKDKKADGVKDEDHCREVESVKIGWNCKRSCCRSGSNHKEEVQDIST